MTARSTIVPNDDIRSRSHARRLQPGVACFKARRRAPTSPQAAPRRPRPLPTPRWTLELGELLLERRRTLPGLVHIRVQPLELVVDLVAALLKSFALRLSEMEYLLEVHVAARRPT